MLDTLSPFNYPIDAISYMLGMYLDFVKFIVSSDFYQNVVHLGLF